jgi:phosphatidylglycerol:prolipoprotein diacylglycerol transferase
VFPKIFSFGDFFLPTYGVLVALGCLCGLWLAGRLARRAGLNAEVVTNLGVYAILAGLVGAKLLMFVYEFDYYSRNPAQIFSLATLQTGGVFYGGLALALVVAFFYLRRHGLPAATTLDCYGPGLALGQAIGRLGCFAAGCCWGKVCERGPSVTFTRPEAFELTGAPLHVPLHPTQLYEAAAYFAVAFITYRRFSPRSRPGATFGLYLMLAAGARLGIEFLRHHDQPNPFSGPLSTAQYAAAGLMALGFALLRRSSRTRETVFESAAERS